MPDRSVLIRDAEELRERAAQEHDPAIRDHLIRMADHAIRLAAAEDWSAAHPPSAAAIGDLFSKK